MGVVSAGGYKNQRNQTEQFHMVLNGRSYKVILEDEYLKNHFSFLLNFCHNLVGFNFSKEL